jgi:hypothetical protein
MKNDSRLAEVIETCFGLNGERTKYFGTFTDAFYGSLEGLQKSLDGIAGSLADGLQGTVVDSINSLAASNDRIASALLEIAKVIREKP